MPALPFRAAAMWRRHPWVLTGVMIVLVVVVAAGAALVAAVVGSGPAAGDLRVDNPYGNAGGGAVPDIRIGTPYRYLLLPLCTAGDPVRITGVTPHELSGRLTVVDWAVTARAALSYRDAVPGRAHDLFGHDATTTVSWRCSADRGGAASAFAVGIALRSPHAVARGWDVRSTSGTVYVPFTIAECTASTCPVPDH